MGIKNRILRRQPDPQTAVAADPTAQPPVAESAGAGGDTAVFAVPASAEHAAQGDALTGAEAPAPDDAAPAPAPAPAEAAPQGDPLLGTAPSADPAAAEHAPAADGQPVAPPPPQRPGFRERGQLRRRLRFLREARELGFRDLGGLVFDQHRFQRPNEALVQGKVAAIDAVDRELRAIEDVLAARRPYEELFLAGVSACPRCGALHGTDARFCPNCGLDFAGPRAVAGIWTEGSGAPAAGAPAGQSALFDPHAANAETPPAPPA